MLPETLAKKMEFDKTELTNFYCKCYLRGPKGEKTK